jgi:predicted ATPase/transcriptional regulator with XRE-family HTH domain
MSSMSIASFGDVLRRHRLRAALTQEDLAERAGLSARGIQQLERGERTSPRAETVRMLADALALSSEERAELIAAARPELAAASPAPPQRPALTRPPTPPTPLVGREREVASACALLRQSGARLLTLTGPGGIGKTRLALAVAAEVEADFADGVAWVDLAPLDEPGLVAHAVAAALGMGENGESPLPELLARAVADRHLLLVVDNCEHLLPAMPLLGTLLVRLFIERAAAVRPGFALTTDNAAAVAAICQRLEGLPLALELAAAWVKVLSPQALLMRLAQRLPLLTGGTRDTPARQQTMLDAIRWSYDLLSDAEQRLFRCLAIFAGSFTLEAAESVSDERRQGGEMTSDTLGLILALLDQSLLRLAESSVGDNEARFVMLETVREFATDRLADAGETAAVRHAHMEFYLAFAERADAELIGPAQGAWLERLEAEHNNLRAALASALTDGETHLSGGESSPWQEGIPLPAGRGSGEGQREGGRGLEEERETALRLAAALGRFWRMRGHPQEGSTWLDRALAQSDESPTAARAKALEGAGRLAHDQDDPDRAGELYEAALVIWRALGDRRGQARLLDDLGNIAHDRGDFARAVSLHEQALALAREAGDRRGAARAFNNLGMVALYQSQDERAGQLYQEALALLRELGDDYGINIVLNNLGIVAIRRGELDEAAALYDECLSGCRRLGDQRGVGGALANLGEVRQRQGDLVQAEALYEEARQILLDLGDNRAAAAAFHGLAGVALAQDDATCATSHFRTSLALALSADDKMTVADNLEGVADVAIRRGDTVRGAQLLGAASALRARIEAPVAAHRRTALEAIVSASRTVLSEATFTEAWNTGQGWSLAEAVSEAMELADEIGGSPS